jgi:hypothetical protein
VISELGGAAWRGLVAAMAMSGVRELTTDVGLVDKPPPDEIATEGVPSLLAAVPAEYRGAAIELAHWSYGAAMGAGYAVLPRRLRARRWFGPAFGLAIWAGFEAGIAPLLDLRSPEQRPLRERLSIAADHVLYGVIVSRRAFDPTA